MLVKNRQKRSPVVPLFPAQCHLPGTSPVLGCGARVSSPTAEPDLSQTLPQPPQPCLPRREGSGNGHSHGHNGVQTAMSTALTRATTATTARAAVMATATATTASKATPRFLPYSPALTFITELTETNEVLDGFMGRKNRQKHLPIVPRPWRSQPQQPFDGCISRCSFGRCFHLASRSRNITENRN